MRMLLKASLVLWLVTWKDVEGCGRPHGRGSRILEEWKNVKPGRKCIKCDWRYYYSKLGKSCIGTDITKNVIASLKDGINDGIGVDGLKIKNCGDSECKIEEERNMETNELISIIRGCQYYIQYDVPTGCKSLTEIDARLNHTTCWKSCSEDFCNSNDALERRNINASPSIRAFSLAAFFTLVLGWTLSA